MGDCRPSGASHGLAEFTQFSARLTTWGGAHLSGAPNGLLIGLTAWDAVEAGSVEADIWRSHVHIDDEQSVRSAPLEDVMHAIDATLLKAFVTCPTRILAVSAVTCLPLAHARTFHRATAAPRRISAVAALAYGASVVRTSINPPVECQAACGLPAVSCSIAVLTAMRSRELGVRSPLSHRETVAWFTPIFAAIAAWESPRRLRSDAMSITPIHICAFA